MSDIEYHLFFGTLSGFLLCIYIIGILLGGALKEILAVETENWVSKHVCVDKSYLKPRYSETYRVVRRYLR